MDLVIILILFPLTRNNTKVDVNGRKYVQEYENLETEKDYRVREVRKWRNKIAARHFVQFSCKVSCR